MLPVKPEQKINIYDLSYEELRDLLLSWHEPEFRCQQIWKGLYENLWNTPEQFSNLPIKLREKLNDYFGFNNINQETELFSNDHQTIKTLFRLSDQLAIESVLMGYDQRRTLCISTQAGCAMGCVFCATGQMGFNRHLSSGEIVEQVLFYARKLKENGEKITNVVIMGMGEPFHNYQNTIKAIDILNDDRGLNLGERRFTVSTVGLIPAIHQFTEARRQVNLAVSLHAANDELRSSMLPINKKYPIEDLIKACKEYVEATHRRITFEYALVEGVNDSNAQAHELAELLKGMLCHVNLITLNPIRKFNGKGSSHKSAQAFSEILNKAGIPNTIRLRRGIDIQAGCGQLASQS
jgi:23S rRNA (adenine2503-C2)-methyltransferase